MSVGACLKAECCRSRKQLNHPVFTLPAWQLDSCQTPLHFCICAQFGRFSAQALLCVHACGFASIFIHLLFSWSDSQRPLPYFQSSAALPYRTLSFVFQKLSTSSWLFITPAPSLCLLYHPLSFFSPFVSKLMIFSDSLRWLFVSLGGNRVHRALLHSQFGSSLSRLVFTTGLREAASGHAVYLPPGHWWPYTDIVIYLWYIAWSMGSFVTLFGPYPKDGSPHLQVKLLNNSTLKRRDTPLRCSALTHLPRLVYFKIPSRLPSRATVYILWGLGCNE